MSLTEFLNPFSLPLSVASNAKSDASSKLAFGEEL